MLNFKHELKTEIGVFFGSMLLRTLDTDNSRRPTAYSCVSSFLRAEE